MKSTNTKYGLPLINAEDYQREPSRYTLKKGSTEGAPLCPFGNEFQWLGYDERDERYVRFTKSVFKRLVDLEALPEKSDIAKNRNDHV